MKPLWIPLLCTAILSAGCAGLKARKPKDLEQSRERSKKDVVGLPYYLTMPSFAIEVKDLHEKKKAKPRYDIKMTPVADPSHRYEVRLKSGWLSNDVFNLTLLEDGRLVKMGASSEGQVGAIVRSLGSFVAEGLKLVPALAAKDDLDKVKSVLAGLDIDEAERENARKVAAAALGIDGSLAFSEFDEDERGGALSTIRLAITKLGTAITKSHEKILSLEKANEKKLPEARLSRDFSTLVVLEKVEVGIIRSDPRLFEQEHIETSRRMAAALDAGITQAVRLLASGIEDEVLGLLTSSINGITTLAKLDPRSLERTDGNDPLEVLLRLVRGAITKKEKSFIEKYFDDGDLESKEEDPALKDYKVISEFEGFEESIVKAIASIKPKSRIVEYLKKAKARAERAYARFVLGEIDEQELQTYLEDYSEAVGRLLKYDTQLRSLTIQKRAADLGKLLQEIPSAQTQNGNVSKAYTDYRAELTLIVQQINARLMTLLAEEKTPELALGTQVTRTLEDIRTWPIDRIALLREVEGKKLLKLADIWIKYGGKEAVIFLAKAPTPAVQETAPATNGAKEAPQKATENEGSNGETQA